MEEALRFVRAYEILIYVVLGVLAFWQILQFARAWEELRGAAFGLERESAQEHLNSAAILLVLIIIIASGVFTLVSFVAPSVPGANPLPTPTLNLLATPTITLPPTTPGAEGTVVATSASSTAALPSSNSCVPGQVMLTEPKDGDEVSGVVTLKGTADIPNFGFYKYEVARPGDAVWLTISAGRTVVRADKLGDWDTKAIPPGDYLLRLVVTDNQGQAMPACTIRLRISAPAQP